MNNLDYLEDCQIKLEFTFPEYTLWIAARLNYDEYVISAEGKGENLIFPGLKNLHKEEDIMKYILEADYSNPLYKSNLVEVVEDKYLSPYTRSNGENVKLLEGDILPESWVSVNRDCYIGILSDFEDNLYSEQGNKVNLAEYKKGTVHSKYTSCTIYRKNKYFDNLENIETKIEWQ